MSKFKNLTYFILGLILIITIYQFFLPTTAKPKLVSMSEISQNLNEAKVKSIKVENDKLTAELKDGSKLETYKESSAKLSDYGITADKTEIDIVDPSKGDLWTNILSFLLPFIMIGVLFYFMYRSAQGANTRAMSFGKTTARLAGAGKRMTFQDVAGAEESKRELFEIVDFLKYPERFKKLGAEIPKGVLMIGPPGTGKTLLAKAVAGESGVPFFSISASEFVEMFVGVGAARVRDLFLKAKRNAPAILFVDELDAIGRQRGTGLGGSHDEREQTLNQILVEMDGFDTDTRVIVMAATNRPDVLDPALLRPGRFDRRVVLSLPDKNERLAILKIHSQGKPLDKSVKLEHVAAVSVGFSGADLKNLANEAAILAARENRQEISASDFNAAFEKIALGPEKKSKIISQKEREITAYHEAGHALVNHLLANTDKVHKISIVTRGMALGYTWTRPEEDLFLESKERFEDEISVLLAGRVTEQMIFHTSSTGAANDLKKATKLARDMVTQYGMSEKIGPITLGEKDELVFLGRELGEHKTYSERIASLIDEELARIVKSAEEKAKKILARKKTTLQKVAKKLLEKETLEGAEFEKLIR